MTKSLKKGQTRTYQVQLAVQEVISDSGLKSRTVRTVGGLDAEIETGTLTSAVILFEKFRNALEESVGKIRPPVKFSLPDEQISTHDAQDPDFVPDPVKTAGSADSATDGAPCAQS